MTSEQRLGGSDVAQGVAQSRSARSLSRRSTPSGGQVAFKRGVILLQLEGVFRLAQLANCAPVLGVCRSFTTRRDREKDYCTTQRSGKFTASSTTASEKVTLLELRGAHGLQTKNTALHTTDASVARLSDDETTTHSCWNHQLHGQALSYAGHRTH